MGNIDERILKVALIANEEIKGPDKYTQQLFAYRKEAAIKYMESNDEEGKEHILEIIEYTNDSIKKVLNIW